MSNYGISSLFLPELLTSFKKYSSSIQDEQKCENDSQNLVLNITVDENGDLNGVIGNTDLKTNELD